MSSATARRTSHETLEDRLPTDEEMEATRPKFSAYTGKIRKPGTGGIYELNDHLYEGRYSPTNAQGKREVHTVYAKTREEAEALLEQNLMEGHEDTYGLYIDAMDGEVASASENKAWCFDKNGEMVETGVAQTILEDGSVYNFYIVTW